MHIFVKLGCQGISHRLWGCVPVLLRHVIFILLFLICHSYLYFPSRVGSLLERHTSSSVDSVENLEQAEMLHINQSELIQPTEVMVSDTVTVERAEPVLTPQGT